MLVATSSGSFQRLLNYIGSHNYHLVLLNANSYANSEAVVLVKTSQGDSDDCDTLIAGRVFDRGRRLESIGNSFKFCLNTLTFGVCFLMGSSRMNEYTGNFIYDHLNNSKVFTVTKNELSSVKCVVFCSLDCARTLFDRGKDMEAIESTNGNDCEFCETILHPGSGTISTAEDNTHELIDQMFYKCKKSFSGNKGYLKLQLGYCLLEMSEGVMRSLNGGRCLCCNQDIAGTIFDRGRGYTKNLHSPYITFSVFLPLMKLKRGDRREVFNERLVRIMEMLVVFKRGVDGHSSGKMLARASVVLVITFLRMSLTGADNVLDLNLANLVTINFQQPKALSVEE
ncbi:hypothetical protein C5167_016555, partial [Papaver somniferum]